MQASRPYYLCPDCHRGQFPADVELDIVNAEFSPGVRRMLALVGQQVPFDHGRQQIKLLADLEVTTKQVERTAEAIGEDIAVGEQAEIQRAKQLDLPIVLGKPIPILYVQMDATGIPVVKKETVGRQGKDGHPARHRDVKLGCVFTQTTWDTEGYAIRDPDSTTYVAAIETAEEFGKRIYLEAWKRGWSRAEKKVVIGDGAEWIWNIADLHFPGAIQIVDLYHARQHLWDLARKLYPNQEAEQRRWMMVHQDMLDEGKIQRLGSSPSVRSITSNPELAEIIRTTANYFETNAQRMRYPKFRQPAPVCRLGCHRSWLQDRYRFPLQAVGHVLDCTRGERYPGSAMLPLQWPLRGLLGGPPRMTSTFMSRTPPTVGRPRCRAERPGTARRYTAAAAATLPRFPSAWARAAEIAGDAAARNPRSRPAPSPE